MMFVLYCQTKKMGPWSSDNIKSRKPFSCAYCEKRMSKGTVYRWVDGGKSCEFCNLKEHQGK